MNTEHTRLFVATTPSPLGEIFVISNDSAVVALDYADEWSKAHQQLRRTGHTANIEDGDPTGAIPNLVAFFDGVLATSDHVVIATTGTVFQTMIWRLLRSIPAGYTATYGELAVRAGVVNGARAVGAACRNNPLAIVVPCHRALGRDGSLRGYAGGIDRKRWLLDHECKWCEGPRRLSQSSYERPGVKSVNSRRSWQ